jgi:hypothetical protein
VSDYYMVIGLQHMAEDVASAAQVFVATGNSEEEAVAKVAAIDSEAELFTAQVVPTFPPPEPSP